MYSANYIQHGFSYGCLELAIDGTHVPVIQHTGRHGYSTQNRAFGVLKMNALEDSDFDFCDRHENVVPILCEKSFTIFRVFFLFLYETHALLPKGKNILSICLYLLTIS
ncbi:hypothetical protein ACJX0J_027815 [Zea mays]